MRDRGALRGSMRVYGMRMQERNPRDIHRNTSCDKDECGLEMLSAR